MGVQTDRVLIFIVRQFSRPATFNLVPGGVMCDSQEFRHGVRRPKKWKIAAQRVRYLEMLILELLLDAVWTRRGN